MIVGIGTDIVQLSRIRAALARRGPALARRLLDDHEWIAWQRYAADASAAGRFLGKRFAAKEAALKAMGSGLRGGLRWQDIGVRHSDAGQPLLQLSGAATMPWQHYRLHLSISDEQDYAFAFVIIESTS